MHANSEQEANGFERIVFSLSLSRSLTHTDTQTHRRTQTSVWSAQDSFAPALRRVTLRFTRTNSRPTRQGPPAR